MTKRTKSKKLCTVSIVNDSRVDTERVKVTTSSDITTNESILLFNILLSL